MGQCFGKPADLKQKPYGDVVSAAYRNVHARPCTCVRSCFTQTCSPCKLVWGGVWGWGWGVGVGVGCFLGGYDIGHSCV
jgi:hypothetical protein